MALVVNDRVKEESTTTGTGTLTLSGAVAGFETFSSAIGNTNTTYYAIQNQDVPTEFEVGLGTVAAGTLARTTIISSSNSDSAVNFSAGTKDVFCTLPASKAVILDSSGNIVANNGSNLTNLNADNLASGTVPDARFPATLPAANGSNLTALNATQLTSGTVPIARIDLDLLTVTSNDANADFFAVINSAGAQTKITKGSINNSGFNNDSGFIDGSSLNADNLSSGTVPSARVSGAYTGITQTGTLTSFTSTGIDDNATSTAITINSNENVLIGGTSESALDGVSGIVVGSNTASSAGIAFENSAHSYLIYSGSSNDSLLFYDSANDTERMRINSSGNVGIGTSSPESTLHVEGTSDLQSPIKVRAASTSGLTLISDRYLENESFSNIGLAHSGGALVLGSFVKPSDSSESDATGYLSSFDGSSIKRSAIKIDGVNGEIKFLTTDTSATVAVDTAVAMTERMRIDSSGNVGIGTNSPANKLTLAENDSNTVITNGSSNLELSNINGTNNTYSRMIFNDTAGGAGAGIFGVKLTDTTNNYGQFEFWTRGSSTADTRMVIEPNGNVGIGTVSPSELLNIVGGVSEARVRFDQTSAERNNFVGLLGDADQLAISADESNLGGDSHIVFRVDASERMRIDSSGDVGIGTTSTNLNSFNKAVTLSGTTNAGYELAKGSTLHGAFALQGDNRVQLINFQDADLTFNTGTGATERMRVVHSTGNVGIGTTSPSQTLDVSGAGARIYITGANEDISMDNSANGQISIDGNGYNAGIALDADAMNIYTNSASRDVVLGVNETEILRAKPAGVDITGIVTAAQLNLDGGGDIHSTIDTSSINVAGGTNSNVGANISVYGSTHASLANVVRFRASASETMRIDSSGNVGIGLTSPAFPLNVATPSTDGVTALFGAAVSPNAAGTYLGFDDSDATAVLGVYYASTAYPVLEITRSTRVASFTTGLNVTGAITATGDITAFYTSDKNLKQNIVNIDNSLDKVSKLNGVYYNWTKEALEKNTHLKDEKEVGVIAQDVEAVLPELVATREDGSKAVRYERLCAVLIESIKELKKEIEELKK